LWIRPNQLQGFLLGSAQLPTPIVQYTIVIPIGPARYVYVMRADGRPIEHFAIRDGELEGLDLPDRFEERQGWEGLGRSEKASSFLDQG
jgi:hypothetical protein